jgi:hypothetical protein
MQVSSTKRITVAVAAMAMMISSTGAIAARPTFLTPVSVGPLVALSLLQSDASRAALCGASSAAAAGAAAATQATAPPCVLPVTDAAPPPPVPVVENVPPPPPVVEGGFHVPPLLLGLVGIALAVAIFQAIHDDDNGDEFNSPV